MLKRFWPALGAMLALLATTSTVRVHPHVFAEARLDVIVNPDNTVKTLRNVWRFDDVFSSTVIMEFDKNSDLKLDEGELHEVSQTIFESLAEYGYFQLVTLNGKDVPMNAPKQLIADYQSDQLVVLFESEPKEKLPLSGKVDFGIYDPTFYTAIDFTEDDHMAVDRMPATCTRSVIRPDPDEILANSSSTLTDAFFNDPAGSDISKVFATRLELDCKTS